MKKLRSIVKKLVILFVLLLVATIGGAAYFYTQLTSDVVVDFDQDPNPVEAHEANRKLKLFEESQEAKRQGFIRLSEVELNSLLAQNYFGTNRVEQTNSPVNISRARLHLQGDQINVVTWLDKTVFGYQIPVTWQRIVVPEKTDDGWSLKVLRMQFGELNVPKQYWDKINSVLGDVDSMYREPMLWIKNLPLIAMERNKESQKPEIRFYNYLPATKPAS